MCIFFGACVRVCVCVCVALPCRGTPRHSTRICICVYVCMCVWEWEYVCVRVRERERVLASPCRKKKRAESRANILCVNVYVCVSCYTYKWVMSHTWRSYFSNMKQSCNTNVYVSMCVCHVTLMNESCHTYEAVKQHKCFHLAPTVAFGACMFVCHVTHMNEACHTYETLMQHKCFHLAHTMAFGACMCICKHTCIYKYSNKYLQICVFAKMFYQARFFYSIKYQRSSLALPHCGNLAYIRVFTNIHIYK